MIRDPQQARERLGVVAGDKYSYRQMDDFTDIMRRDSKRPSSYEGVARGHSVEKIFLLYSEGITSYGLQPETYRKF